MVALWSVIGLLVLTSASWWVAEREMGDGAFYLKRQLVWMAASWGLLWFGMRTSLRRWLHIGGAGLLVGLVLVVVDGEDALDPLSPSLGTQYELPQDRLTIAFWFSPGTPHPLPTLSPTLSLSPASLCGAQTPRSCCV